jgi:hypothetical protein
MAQSNAFERGADGVATVSETASRLMSLHGLINRVRTNPLAPTSPLLNKVSGVADGLASAAHLAQAVSAFHREGEHSDSGYEHLGGATLSGSSAYLSFTNPAAALLLRGGTALVDGIGNAAGAAGREDMKFNSNQIAGGVLRGMFGDRSLGRRAEQYGLDHLRRPEDRDDTATRALLGAGNTAVNLAAAPINTMMAVTGGLSNYLGRFLEPGA